MAIKRTIFDVLMTDGTEHTGIVLTIDDQFRAAEASAKRKWSSTQQGMFAVYCAMQRTGVYAGSFDQWRTMTETAAEREVEDVDPTQTAASAV